MGTQHEMAMKALVAASVVALTISLPAASCIYESHENSYVVNSRDAISPTVDLPNLSDAELLKLQKYAEAYEPKSGDVVIPEPPVPNKEISRIISKAADTRTREHEKFIMLIFLRLSRFQIENFKQRYELGRTNSLTKEFYRLIGQNDYERAEFMPAYLGDNYVEKNPHLRDYKLIDTEMKRIAKAGERIKRELDSTSAKRPGH